MSTLAGLSTSYSATTTCPQSRGVAQQRACRDQLEYGPSGTWRGYNPTTTADWIKPKSNKYDVVVVGGGHNGLVSAAYLGKQGLNVLVNTHCPFPSSFSPLVEMVGDSCLCCCCCWSGDAVMPLPPPSHRRHTHHAINVFLHELFYIRHRNNSATHHNTTLPTLPADRCLDHPLIDSPPAIRPSFFIAICSHV